jgi:hypothetical protein
MRSKTQSLLQFGSIRIHVDRKVVTYVFFGQYWYPHEFSYILSYNRTSIVLSWNSVSVDRTDTLYCVLSGHEYWSMDSER